MPHFNRRTFLNAMAGIPFLGLSFKRSNQNRLKELVARLGGNPRIMVVYHDYYSAYKVIKHLGLKSIHISLQGTSQYVPPGTQAAITFHQNRPNGGDTLDPISADAWQEARICHLIISQHPSKYGTFTVVKNRFDRHGEVLNVFTHKRPPAVSNV